MKSKIIYMLILSCALLLLASCYRDLGVVNSSIAEKNDFNFGSDGGMETVRILRWGRKPIRGEAAGWDYHACFSSRLSSEYMIDMRVDTLTDGSVKISNEWITFSSPKDRKTIKIDVKKNTSKKERMIIFRANSLALGFTLTVKQDK